MIRTNKFSRRSWFNPAMPEVLVRNFHYSILIFARVFFPVLCFINPLFIPSIIWNSDILPAVVHLVFMSKLRKVRLLYQNCFRFYLEWFLQLFWTIANSTLCVWMLFSIEYVFFYIQRKQTAIRQKSILIRQMWYRICRMRYRICQMSINICRMRISICSMSTRICRMSISICSMSINIRQMRIDFCWKQIVFWRMWIDFCQMRICT